MITISTLDDVTELEKLINLAYRGESSKLGWTTESNILRGKRITRDELSKIIKEEENTILKFINNDIIVACVLLTNKKDELYLGMLTVLPELQNSGIGKMILQQAEQHARLLKVPKIVMTVISIRKELIDWYTRHGYIDTGIKEPFPLNNTDAVIDQKHLEFIVLEKKVF